MKKNILLRIFIGLIVIFSIGLHYSATKSLVLVSPVDPEGGAEEASTLGDWDANTKAYYDEQFNNHKIGTDFTISSISMPGDDSKNPPTIRITGRAETDDKVARPTYTFSLKEVAANNPAGISVNYYYFQCSHVNSVLGGCERIALRIPIRGYNNEPSVFNGDRYTDLLYKSDPDQLWNDTTAVVGNGTNWATDLSEDELRAFSLWATGDDTGNTEVDESYINSKMEYYPSHYSGEDSEIQGTDEDENLDSSLSWMERKITTWFGDAVNQLLQTGTEALLIVDIVSDTEETNDLNGEEQGIVTAWAMVRNVSNTLMVLAFLILIIANVTRYQLEVYTIRALLPRLIIAAIFINFSYLMSAIIIDLGNVLTKFFIQETDFARILGFGDSGAADVASALGKVAGAWVATQILGWFLYLTIIVALIIVISVLIIRKAVIYVLVVVSPLVFLFSILPFTRTITSFWWKQFTRYVFMGAFIALLLYIAAII